MEKNSMNFLSNISIFRVICSFNQIHPSLFSFCASGGVESKASSRPAAVAPPCPANQSQQGLMRTWSPFCLSLLLHSLLPLCVMFCLFLSFCFISTTSMKNHIHSKLRSFIILFIVSFNLASLCRGEEIQLNEMTKLHPWTDGKDRCSHIATGPHGETHSYFRQEVETLGFNQNIAMRQ